MMHIDALSINLRSGHLQPTMGVLDPGALPQSPGFEARTMPVGESMLHVLG